MGQWVAAIFAYGLVLNPRLTRMVGSIFNILVLSDFLHAAYTGVMRLSERAEDDG
jgi:hypothetical protein